MQKNGNEELETSLAENENTTNNEEHFGLSDEEILWNEKNPEVYPKELENFLNKEYEAENETEEADVNETQHLINYEEIEEEIITLTHYPYIFEEDVSMEASESEEKILYEEIEELEDDYSDETSPTSFDVNLTEEIKDPLISWLDDQYYALEVNKDVLLYKPERNTSFSSPAIDGYETCARLNHLCNKVLIIRKDDVQVLTSATNMDNNNLTVFVIDKSVIKEIKNNVYNLDDLQYDIAKAIGIRPEYLKISFIIKQMNNLKKRYNKIHLTRSDSSKYIHYHPLLHGYSDKGFEVNRTDTQFSVSIVIKNLVKGFQWLGGFKNTKTDTNYNNVTTQTDPRRRNNDEYKYSRETQTRAPSKEVEMNLPVDHSTQMWRFDHYMPADRDVIISPGLYVPCTSLQHKSVIRNKAAITIQKCWKGYYIRKRIFKTAASNYSRYQRVKNSLLLSDPTSQYPDFNQNNFNIQLLNMIFPYKRKDFHKMHWILNKFNIDKREDIKKKHEQPFCQKAQLCLLLDKEIELLRSIQCQSISSKLDSFVKKQKQFLESLSTPLLQENYEKGSLRLTEKHGSDTCNEFEEIFVLYRRQCVNSSERLEILTTIRQLLEKFGNFEMKEDLLELLRRECILISSGIPEKNLRIHSKRVEEIFHHFIINPGNQAIVPHKVRPLIKCMYRCKNCNLFKHISSFPFYTKQQGKIGTCKACLYKFQTSYAPKNISTYMNVLQQIRKDEYSRGCRNPYITYIQPEEMQFIISTIWGGKSILSNVSVISQLRLPRWDNRQPWAPWNCILLTTDETKLHEGINNVYQFYSKEFCSLIKIKHLRILMEFQRLPLIEKKLRNIWLTHPDKAFQLNLNDLVNALNTTGDRFFQAVPTEKYPNLIK